MQHRFLRVGCLILAAALFVATAVHAQSRIYEFRGPNAGCRYGQSVAGIGDVNRDGCDDFIIGLPDGTGAKSCPGLVLVVSGREGTILKSLQGSWPGDRFGASACGAGDMDRDGVPDFVVGAPGSQLSATQPGYARLYSGKTWGVLRSFHGSTAGEGFGWSVACAGDVDKDGDLDLVISAPQGGTRRQGRAVVVSGPDGRLLHTMTGAGCWDYFGWSVAEAGDVDLDGHADFMVGSPGIGGATSVPCAFVYSGKTGLVLSSFVANGAHAVGKSVSGVGDVNGDKHADYAVGCPGSDSGQPGFIAVLSGNTHSVLFTMHGLSASFGHVVGAAGDADQDGTPDIFVAECGDPTTQPTGSVTVVSGKTGRTIHATTGGTPNDQYGASACSAGDVNGDGVPDLAAGAPEIRTAGAGYVRVYSGCRLPLTTDRHTLSIRTGGFQVLRMNAGGKHGTRTYRLGGSQSGTRPGVVIQGRRIPLNPDGYFAFTILNPEVAPLSRFSGQLAPDGTAAATFTLPSGLPPSAVGITLHHAFVVMASKVVLVSNAVPVTLVP